MDGLGWAPVLQLRHRDSGLGSLRPAEPPGVVSTIARPCAGLSDVSSSNAEWQTLAIPSSCRAEESREKVRRTQVEPTIQLVRGAGEWRVRTADHHTVCEIQDDHPMVLVSGVGPRRDIIEARQRPVYRFTLQTVMWC